MSIQQLSMTPPARMRGEVMLGVEGLWTPSIVVWESAHGAWEEVDRVCPLPWVEACATMAEMVIYQADPTF